MHVAAWRGAKFALFGAAATFGICAALAAARVPALTRHVPRKLAAARAVVESTRISALVYGWGALALLSIYRFTPIHWQHGWQYGSGMLLISLGLVTYLLALDRDKAPLAAPPSLDRIIAMAAGQGLACAGGVAYLVLAGKLSSPKGDWAANAVFLAGGLTMVWISYLAVSTHRDLKRLALREELAG